MPGANIAYSQWSRMWLFEAFFTAFRSVLSDSDETRIAPLAICDRCVLLKQIDSANEKIFS